MTLILEDTSFGRGRFTRRHTIIADADAGNHRRFRLIAERRRRAFFRAIRFYGARRCPTAYLCQVAAAFHLPGARRDTTRGGQ